MQEQSPKDVIIPIRGVNVENPDAETKAAQDAINGRLLAGLEAQNVTVVVIHKPTNTSTSHTVPVTSVRKYAEAAIAGYALSKGALANPATDNDFAIVEVHEGSNLVRVSTLEKL